MGGGGATAGPRAAGRHAARALRPRVPRVTCMTRMTCMPRVTSCASCDLVCLV